MFDRLGVVLGAAPGEAVGEGFLLVAEHVDRQRPAAREHLAGCALAGEAEQHQRRGVQGVTDGSRHGRPGHALGESTGIHQKLQADLAAYAKDPKTGVQMAVIMGDGYPAFAIGGIYAIEAIQKGTSKWSGNALITGMDNDADATGGIMWTISFTVKGTTTFPT